MDGHEANTIDIVIGPIEVYDKLLALKASHEAIVLIKDREWSRRLTRYAEFLPWLHGRAPVPEAYRSEQPGLDADLNVYDAIYHAGQSNARPTASAINLPNDEFVALEKGTRRLQLKNVMRAKFDSIVGPIADLLVADDQRTSLTFDAWFEMLMFHEVAHGLGIPSNGRRSWHCRQCAARAGTPPKNRRPTPLACPAWLIAIGSRVLLC